ncbi:MAG: hypothetical protein RLZZ245_2667 [Verrucomicrobiota bacterium]
MQLPSLLKHCFVIMGIAYFNPSIHAAEWHVSPVGKDSADGTAQAPFQSIARGLNAAKPGDTILLHGGVYRETITPSQSGRSGAPVTLRNAPGATPVISACDPVTGPWTGENGIFRASIPAAPGLMGAIPMGADAASSGVDQIFIDGNPQPEARFPNKRSGDPMEHEGMKVTLQSDFTIITSSVAGKPGNFFAGARIHARIHPNWTAQNSVVTSSVGDKLVIRSNGISSPWWPNPARKADADNKHSTSAAHGEAFLFGTKNLIDADGEWHIDRASTGDTLFLRPPAGRDPAELRIERKIRPWTVDLSGVDHWVVKGLHLEGGAVRMRGNSLVLEECELRNSSHFHVFALGYGYDGGRDFGSAVLIDGKDNVVRKCRIRDSAGSGICLKGSGHHVTRNEIRNVDYSGTYAAGIVLGGTAHRIEFNTIRDTGRDCIAIEGGGHEITYNDLSRSGRLTFDGGMVYTYCQNGVDASGKRTLIAYNWVHESGNPADPKSRGIYIDNYSRGFSIHHNVVWGFGQSDKNKGMHLGAPSQDIAFYHNTLIACLPPTSATFTKFPLVNRDPAFWTEKNNGLSYIYQNNLHLPGDASARVLENFATRDFRPRAGSSAVDPARTENVIRWETKDGKSGVPTGYVLYAQDSSVPFTFLEMNGQGVPVPGINDDTTGATPDDGAYERGKPQWRPGHDGFPHG